MKGPAIDAPEPEPFAKWASDPDMVRVDGTVMFVGPKGVLENEEAHQQRLMHNSRMRFNRSISGWIFILGFLICWPF